jgi:hypothetical protein
MTRILVLAWPELRTTRSGPIFEALLDALDELSPRVESPADGVALVDVTGLGPLFGDERRIARRAAALASGAVGRQLALRAGIGDNRWLASLAARLARPTAPLAFGAVPSGEGRGFCARLSLGLLPADAALRRRFALFGLTLMGELAVLPRSAVGAQFGPSGERLQALARGEDPRPVVPRPRPALVSSRLMFEPPLDEIGGIALGLRRCSTQLCERLRIRGLAPGRATLSVELETTEPIRLELALSEPSLDPDWITCLLLGRLEAELRAAIEPFSNPIDIPTPELAASPPGINGIHIRRELVPAEAAEAEEPRVVGIGLALDRLSDAGGRQLPAFEPRFQRWQELQPHLERITARFGDGRLWRARHDRPMASLPERRSRLVEIGPQA